MSNHHARANAAQSEYFEKRERYRKMTNKELVDSLREFGVPFVLLEILEDRIAGLESV